MPRITIVIPCRNERGRILECAASVLVQAPPDGGFEVIFADGMSDDGTREILQARCAINSGWRQGPTTGIMEPETWSGEQRTWAYGPDMRVIDNPSRIVSTGLNAAIGAARGDIIVRMDAHTDYAPDYLRQCVAVLDEVGADNVGGPWVARGQGCVSRAIAGVFQSAFGVGGARGHDPGYSGPVDTVYLGCWRREIFERFGYFDEELVRNQDDEHNLRIIRGGGKIWQSPKIKSWYHPRGSLSALFKQYMQYGYWKVRVIQKHKIPASWRHLVPGAFVLVLLVLFLLSGFTCLFSTFAAVLWSRSPVVLWPHFPLASLLLVYFLAILAASIHTAARTEWKLLPVMPLVFPCYHFGYGWGFLRGIWDFVVRRKGGQQKFSALTR